MFYDRLRAVLAVLALLGGLRGCADFGALSPIDLPPPPLESIIPLSPGNRWEYSVSRYDSSGRQTRSREQAVRTVTEVFAYTPDSGIQAIHWPGEQAGMRERAYAYRWMHADAAAGVIIGYRSSQLVDTPGVYVYGEYRGAQIETYAPPRLFLAYPAQPGDTWAGADGSHTVCIDTNALLYFPDDYSQTPSSITAYRCWHYLTAAGDSAIHTYYHKDIGLLGTVLVRDSIIRQTSILRRFTAR